MNISSSRQKWIKILSSWFIMQIITEKSRQMSLRNANWLPFISRLSYLRNLMRKMSISANLIFFRDNENFREEILNKKYFEVKLNLSFYFHYMKKKKEKKTRRELSFTFPHSLQKISWSSIFWVRSWHNSRHTTFHSNKYPKEAEQKKKMTQYLVTWKKHSIFIHCQNFAFLVEDLWIFLSRHIFDISTEKKSFFLLVRLVASFHFHPPHTKYNRTFVFDSLKLSRSHIFWIVWIVWIVVVSRAGVERREKEKFYYSHHK